MKNLLLLFAFALLFSSCKKEKEITPDNLKSFFSSNVKCDYGPVDLGADNILFTVEGEKVYIGRIDGGMVTNLFHFKPTEITKKTVKGQLLNFWDESFVADIKFTKE